MRNERHRWVSLSTVRVVGIRVVLQLLKWNKEYPEQKKTLIKYISSNGIGGVRSTKREKVIQNERCLLNSFSVVAGYRVRKCPPTPPMLLTEGRERCSS